MECILRALFQVRVCTTAGHTARVRNGWTVVVLRVNASMPLLDSIIVLIGMYTSFIDLLFVVLLPLSSLLWLLS
jgi:hypothetical protein